MIVVPEAACPGLLDFDAAFAAVEQVFAAMARGDAWNFPVVREAIGHEDALYGFKGGFDRAGAVLGLKAGGYWPHNLAVRGITNHQSTVFLFDPDTGRPAALVGGNYLTAARTAAASAVAIRYLARPDARILGIVGAGHQSGFQLRAALRQRPFEKVVAWNRNPARLDRLAGIAAEHGLPFEAVDLDQLGAQADVIVTNPTHYAVALAYKNGMRAPKVLAKGMGEIALTIRRVGTENEIPTIEAAPLARALYRHVELDSEIPATLYAAVAEVLAYIYQLSSWQHSGGIRPLPPRMLAVPDELFAEAGHG